MSEPEATQKFGKLCLPGDVLFNEGDPGDVMYVVQSGKVHLFKNIRGQKKTLGYAQAGDFFGELAIVNQRPRVATAEAVEETRLLAINAKTFEQMVLRNSEIAVRLIHKLAHRLASADRVITLLLHEGPKAKVIVGLCQLAEEEGEELENGAVRVALNTEVLANNAGIRPEDVQSVLQRLERLKLVEFQGESVLLSNLAQLKEFLDFIE